MCINHPSSRSVRHAQISHSDSLNFCYDRKTTFMEEVYRAISNVKHILRSQRRFQMPLLWVIKNVCNSKTIMSVAASHNEASPQEMSYFLCWQKIFAGVKVWRVDWWEEFFAKLFLSKTTKGKLSNARSRRLSVLTFFFVWQSLMTGKMENLKIFNNVPLSS